MTAKVVVNKTEDNDGYNIFIGKGLIHKVGELIKDNLPDYNKPFLIISGENSARHYLDRIINSLKQAGFHDYKSLIVGEEKIQNIENHTPIIIGGNRFHPLFKTIENYIYIPTTILGMSHDAVMGKPRLVISDINLLNTLDYKYMMSGYSEIAKHAIMKDSEFFEWLESHGRSIFDGDEDARLYAIKKSCQIKAKLFVNPDTKKLLGFGHLYGDAIRKIAKTDLLHGEVLSIGMVASFKFAQKANLCNIDDYKKVRRHLKSMSLPVELYAEYWDADELVDAIDLSRPVILPTKIGELTIFKKELFHSTLIRVAHEIINKE